MSGKRGLRGGRYRPLSGDHGAEPAELGGHEKNSQVGCLWVSEESEFGCGEPRSKA